VSYATFTRKELDAPASRSKVAPSSVSSSLRIGEPNDIYEQEADRMAEAVMSGRRTPAWSISKVRLGKVQRQTPGDQPAPKPNNYDEAAKKLGEAFLKTDVGKNLTDAAKQDPLVKGAEGFMDTLPGKIIAGTAAVGAVSALAATHTALPAEIPEIPLDGIRPGLSVKITYEGPVDRPTKAAITFSYSPKGEEKKPKQTASERYGAETARIAAEQEKFRAGMKYKPGSAEDMQQKQEQKAIEDYTLHRFGSLPGTGGQPLVPTYPALKGPPDTGLRAPTFESPFKPKPIHLLDQQLELKPLTSSNAPSEAEKKEEPTPVQRKAESAATPLDGAAAPAIVHEVLNSPGRPLDKATRDFFEPRFGHDLSQVRIHTGAQATQSAKSVNAVAYSVGGDMVFADRMFAPSTTEGRRLIAHELTHVLQQGAGGRRDNLIGHPVTELHGGQKAAAGRPPRQAIIPQHLGHLGLQRQPQGQGGGLDPDDQKIVDTAQREAANFKCNVGAVLWGILRKHFAGDVRKVAGTGCETALPGLRTEFSTTDPKDPKFTRSVPMIYAGKAFIVGTDAAHLKDRIADVAKEIAAIDDWRVSNFRIDAQDLSNPRVTGQLRSMSNNQLVDYKSKTKDSDVKTYVERLVTFSTPTQAGAAVDPLSGDMTMTVGKFSVVVKPDVRGAADTRTKAKYVAVPPTVPVPTFGKDGKVTGFPGFSPAVTVEVLTSYATGQTPEMKSEYGRGTTPQDVANKATSVRFHEGTHGEDFLDFLRQNPFPVFTGTNGMKKKAFEDAEDVYTKAENAWAKALAKVNVKGDCVGKPTIDEFYKGTKGYKKICP
jgi:hypothetical protein